MLLMVVVRQEGRRQGTAIQGMNDTTINTKMVEIQLLVGLEAQEGGRLDFQ